MRLLTFVLTVAKCYQLYSDRYSATITTVEDIGSAEECQTLCWRYAPECVWFVIRLDLSKCWLKREEVRPPIRSDKAHAGTVGCSTQDTVDARELAPVGNDEWVLTTNNVEGGAHEGCVAIHTNRSACLF